MSDSESESEIAGSKKRKRNIDLWKHNQKKLARAHGESYTSVSGTHVAKKTTGPDCM